MTYLNLRDLADLLTNRRIPRKTRMTPFFFLHQWGNAARDADWVTSRSGRGGFKDGCEIIAFAEVRRK